MAHFIYARPISKKLALLSPPKQALEPRDHFIDSLGIWLSGLCMIHCALTPVALLMLPMMTFIKSEWVHVVLACVLPLIAFAAFIPSYQRHKNPSIIVLGLIGLCFIIFAAVDPFANLNAIAEGLVTSTGSLFLISAHLKNRKQSACDHTYHHCC